MSIVLLVGAPGSLLSSTAKRLGEDFGVAVLDVEARLLLDLTEADAKIVKSRKGRSHAVDMGVVARAFPREKVLALWREALINGLADLPRNEPSVVACHLTLYRSDRHEFYSTAAQLTRALSEHGDDVTEVIQLIDDVYDMYLKLSTPTAELNVEVGFSRWLGFTRKSAPDSLASFLKPSGSEAEHVGIETRTQTLSLLLNWRHQESLSAESLASAFGARFTAFGVKHTFSSLISLAMSSPEQPRKTVYVSHPISAYRRAINIALNDKVESPAWESGVIECNQIPSFLEAANTIVAVMPTAIDELRFYPMAPGASRLTERSPTLGPRWPLMSEGANLINSGIVDPSEVQHSDILIDSASTLHGQQFIGELTRMFEATIYNEIPYRDHLIVANCDAFFVHRPLADKARVSSGVDHEVRHWKDRHQHGASGLRLAILHAAEDIALLRDRWLGKASVLGKDGDAEQARQEGASLRRKTREGIDAYALQFLSSTSDLDSSEAQSILEGRPLEVDQLGGRTELSTAEAVADLRRESLIHGISGFLYERLTLLRDLPSDDVRVFITSDGTALNIENTSGIRDFLENGGQDATVITSIGPHVADWDMTGILIAEPVLSVFLEVDFLSLEINQAHVLGTHPTEVQRVASRRQAAHQAAIELYDQLID